MSDAELRPSGRVQPPSELPSEVLPLLEAMRGQAGFVPNSLLAMAHRPEVLTALLGLARAVMAPGGDVPFELKLMVAYVASLAAGCRYCQAHTAHSAHRIGEPAKVAELWSFEHSPLFSEAERTALRLAMLAGQTPNAVEDADVAAVRAHFGDAGAAEIVAVISFYGFMNRWNDTLATPLEDAPLAFANAELGRAGWQAGKHGAG